jgi:ribosomal protein S19
MSQRLNNDNILVEQGCASIKKTKHFVNFHSRNMVILTKFLDFVMFGTRDLGHNGENFKKITISINHHICPIFQAENNLSKLQFNFAHFIGPILTLRGPTPLDATAHIDILDT